MISALSLGARIYSLDRPFEDRTGSGFIFDEKYYVNAARVIAGVAHAGDTYASDSPPGTDPNGEHPQLGKLIVAAGIRVLGDNAWGWRLTAVLAGSIALLMLYWLVRCAGGSSRLALGVTALAAGENLFLISSRIAVLDIYCVPFMLAGAALFLRRRPLLAGLVLGTGCAIKEFCVYALFALVILEAARGLSGLVERRRAERRRLLALPACAAVTVATFAVLLAVLDHEVVPYHDHRPVTSAAARAAQTGDACTHLWILDDACTHFRFMNHYASDLRGTKGIASHPWQFWFDVEPINYYTTNVTVKVGDQVQSIDTVIAFQGLINPVLLILALPAFALNAVWAVRRRDDLSFLAVAWYLATWLPPEAVNLVGDRTTYLYYMVVTLPGVFLAVARLLALGWIPRLVLGIWIGLDVAGFCILYPFRTWPFT